MLFEYPIQSDRSRFSIRPSLARLGIRIADRAPLPAAGRRRARASSSTATRASCGSIRAGTRRRCSSCSSGFFHILDGTDHLLFLLVPGDSVPPRPRRSSRSSPSFTVAHSITLIASAYDLAPDALWFPPLIETLIAVSIVYMALENIVVARRTLSARWLITFAFGLVHGFGFSFALRETLQFAGSHLLTSLLSFNVGVELGQLLVLVLLVPALDAAVPLRRRRADGDDHPVGARRAHGVALDDRALGRRCASSASSGRSSTPRSSRAPCAG